MPRLKFTSDMVLLLASFFIALAVWLVAKQSDFENQIVAARVVCEGVPDNVEIQIIPSTINVSVQYPKTYAHMIHPEAFTIELKGINENYAGAEDFQYTPITITVRNVVTHNLPESVQPTALGQELVRLGARLYTLPGRVKVITKGEPAQGYRLIQDPPRVEPKQVLLTGAPENIALAKEPEKDEMFLVTNPVDIQGKKENYFQSVTVPLPKGLEYVKDDRLRVQILDKLDVQVHVVIGEKKNQETISDIPIVIKTFSENLKPVYSPDTASVTVEAPISMLKQLDRDTFMFIPRQPLEERAGYTADIAIDARFSDKIPPEIRDQATIIKYQPEVINIRIVSRSPGEQEEEKSERLTITPTLTPAPTSGGSETGEKSKGEN